MAYDVIEPFGSPADDRRTGLVISNLLKPHVQRHVLLEPEHFVETSISRVARYLEETAEEERRGNAT